MTTSPVLSTNLNVLGTLTITSTGSSQIRLTSGDGTRSITAFNFTKTNGTINLTEDNDATATLIVTGSFIHSGGTITSSGSSPNASIQFTGTNNQALSFSGGTISGNVNYLFNNANGFTLTGTATVPAARIVTHTRGIFTGTGTLSYGAGCTLIFNGTVANFTSNYTYPLSNGPTNLTISNSGGVTLHAPRDLPGTLALGTGLLQTNTTNLLTVTNTAAGAITGFGTASYVNGPIARSMTNGNTYIFPVGKNGRYHPAELSAVSGATPVVRFEVVDPAAAPTFDANTLVSVSISEYWEAAVIGGTYTGGTLSLTRSGGLAGNSTIARSNALGGSYTNLGSSGTSGNSVIGCFTGAGFPGFYRLAVPRPAYYRSITNGFWHVPTTWQASNTADFASTFSPVVPPSATNSEAIIVQNTHIVTINGAGGIITMDQTLVQPNGTLVWDEGSIVINNGAGVDLQINGTFDDKNSVAELPSFINTSGNATVVIANAGRILISSDGEDAQADGYASNEYGLDDNFIWENGSIFEWQSTQAFSASGITYFPNANNSTIPIFRISANITTPFGIGVGGGSPTVINGLLEANGSITWGYSGTKTFRNGIRNSATITQRSASPDASGAFIISGETSVLGGTGAIVLNAAGIEHINGICTLENDKTLNAAGGGRFVLTNSNATFNGQSFRLNGTAGYAHSTNSSTLITAHPNGVNGTIELLTGTKTFADRVNYTFNGAGSQSTG
jgi:hypothetical protein